MVQAAQVIFRRLQATWFGSVLALFWLVGLVAIPLPRHCIAVAAVQGGPSGIFCNRTPALEDPTGIGLVLLLAFVAVIVTVPLTLPNRTVLLAVGLGSLAIALVTTLGSLDDGWYTAMSGLGLDITNDARSGLLFLLPASAAWILAAFFARARRGAASTRPGRQARRRG
jgi:hypothetical protein